MEKNKFIELMVWVVLTFLSFLSIFIYSYFTTDLIKYSYAVKEEVISFHDKIARNYSNGELNLNKTSDEIYYYTGNANNFVSFAGFTWRIVRTNEDKSVRIVYSGVSPSSTNSYIGESYFNNLVVGQVGLSKVGYMYGEANILSFRESVYSSDIKNVIDNWYVNNILPNYSEYINQGAIYCNNRNVVNDNFPKDVLFSEVSGSYNCFDVVDQYSVTSGNGKLTYSIGLITADEVKMAGSDSYMFKNSNGESVTGGAGWWTMSAYGYSRNMGNAIWYVNGSGELLTSKSNVILKVRPVISLKSCVTFSEGDGSSTSPYKISLSEMCAVSNN